MESKKRDVKKALKDALCLHAASRHYSWVDIIGRGAMLDISKRSKPTVPEKVATTAERKRFLKR
jgi:hypothetical protein